MLARRAFLGALLGVGAGLLPGVRMRAVGSNPLESPGGSVSDGLVGRITDPVTGAGVFNPNLDPLAVGQDADGTDYAVGTDMSFGSAVRRQIQTNVINGDFSVLPPDGAESLIVSDPTASDYNPLPGWIWSPPADGKQTARIAADSGYASGYVLMISATGAGTGTGSLYQMVAVPMSQGQQYRVLLSCQGTSGFGYSLAYQFYRNDGTTAIGSQVVTAFAANYETKVDAGLVPQTAAYIKIEIVKDASATTGVAVGEVRCAFLPAEASLGLQSRATATGNITTTETQVVGCTIPAGTFTVGSTYRFTAYGVASNSSGADRALTLRVRVGTTTLTGNIAGSRAPNIVNGAAGEGFKAEFLFVIRSTGPAGTCIANGETVGGPSNPLTTNAFVSNGTATVAVDTTVANILELTAVTANASASANFTLALIECVMAS